MPLFSVTVRLGRSSRGRPCARAPHHAGHDWRLGLRLCLGLGLERSLGLCLCRRYGMCAPWLGGVVRLSQAGAEQAVPEPFASLRLGFGWEALNLGLRAEAVRSGA